MQMNWRTFRKILMGTALGAACLSNPAAAQTTVLSETWEGAAVGVINPFNGALSLGNSFTADNTWTVVSPTQDAGTGPHMLLEVLEFGGSKWLAWQNDGVENAINTQVFYNAPITPFELGDVDSITFSADIVPKVLDTGGRRSATFYIGTSTDNAYRFQINFRLERSELLTVSSITLLGDQEVEFGEPANFNSISVDGVYTFNAVITPDAAGTVIDVEFRDGANVIESGQVTFDPTVMLPLDTEVSFFALRGRQRTYQLWDNLLLEYSTVGGEGEGEGEGDDEPVIGGVTILGSTDVEEGGSLNLSVSGATGTYQWFKDGGPISGADGINFFIPIVNPSDAGSYFVRVNTTNKALLQSLPVVVNVLPPGSLPVSGSLGLALLAGACALGGAFSFRKPKRN